jgi:hypothetical protein
MSCWNIKLFLIFDKKFILFFGNSKIEIISKSRENALVMFPPFARNFGS